MLQLEKAHVQQQRASIAKNKKIKKSISLKKRNGIVNDRVKAVNNDILEERLV